MRRVVPVVVFLCAAVAAAAPVPIVMTHSGRLLDGTDQPVNQTGLAFGFTLWSNAEATDASFQVWPATGDATCTVDVTNGLYTVSLGDGTCGSELTSDDFPSGEARFLQVSVDGVTLLPRLRIGTAPTAGVAAHALDAETLGGLAPDAYFQKTDDLAGATVGTGTLAAALAALAAKGGANTFTGDNTFQGTTTFGSGADATSIHGGTVSAATFSGSGTGLMDLGQASLGASGAGTLQDALDARLGSVAAGAGIAVSPGSGTATVALANSAGSLALVSGGAMVSSGGNVGVGKTPAAKLDVAGEVHATRFVGDGSGLTTLSSSAVAAQLPATLARTDQANKFTQDQTFAGPYPSATIAPPSGHAYLNVSRAAATAGEVGIQWQTGGTAKFWAYLANGDDSSLRFYANSADRMKLSDAGDLDVQHTVTADDFRTHGDGVGLGFAHLSCDATPGSYSCTRQQAAAQCKAVGMRLCTVAELNARGEAGYSACSWGWTADPDYSTFNRNAGIVAYVMGSSVSTGYPGGCGGDPGGLRSMVQQDTAKFSAYCCR